MKFMDTFLILKPVLNEDDIKIQDQSFIKSFNPNKHSLAESFRLSKTFVKRVGIYIKHFFCAKFEGYA